MDFGNPSPQPNNTAVKTALWRALHLQLDARPFILEDDVGLKLTDPVEGWQNWPNMKYTHRLRAAVVGRARFVEDLISEQSRKGVLQYVILGAGLDSFAQRKTDLLSTLQVFEIDQPDTLQWKEKRLLELGFNIPRNLHFVKVDFESRSWWEQLLKEGFNTGRPAMVASTGVSLYLSREAIVETLKKLARLATGSIIAFTFYLPKEYLEEEDIIIHELGESSALDAGTPFISFFTENEILDLAQEAGFKHARIINTEQIRRLYFRNRPDQLMPASGEVFLLAGT